MADEFTLEPNTRQETQLNNILRTLNGETATDELVPAWDDEKRLDDILKAASGEDPLYNLPPQCRTHEWLTAIADALSSGGGGGGGGWEKLASEEYTVNTTSTSESSVGYITLSDYTPNMNDILFVHIRDKVGYRGEGYFYGNDTIILFTTKFHGTPGANESRGGIGLYNNGSWYGSASYGVYVGSMVGNTLYIKKRYNAAYSGTINSTYIVEVYKLQPPFTVFSDQSE